MAPPESIVYSSSDSESDSPTTQTGTHQRTTRSRSLAESRSLGQALAHELSSYIVSQTPTPTSSSPVNASNDDSLKTKPVVGDRISIWDSCYHTGDLVVHYRKRDGKIQVGVILDALDDISDSTTTTKSIDDVDVSANIPFSVLLTTGTVVHATRQRLRPLLGTCASCLVNGSRSHGHHHLSSSTSSSSPATPARPPSSTTSASSCSSVSTVSSSWTSQTSSSNHTATVTEVNASKGTIGLSIVDQVDWLVRLASDAREDRDYKRVCTATKYAIAYARAMDIATTMIINSTTPEASSDPQLLAALHAQALVLRSAAQLRLGLANAALRDAERAICLDPDSIDARTCRTEALNELTIDTGKTCDTCGISVETSTTVPFCPALVERGLTPTSTSDDIALSVSRCASPNGMPTTNPRLVACDYANDYRGDGTIDADTPSCNPSLGNKFKFRVRPPMLRSTNTRSSSVEPSTQSAVPPRPRTARARSTKDVAGHAKLFIGGISQSFKIRRSRVNSNAAMFPTTGQPPRTLRSPSSCSALSWPKVDSTMLGGDDEVGGHADCENRCAAFGNRSEQHNNRKPSSSLAHLLPLARVAATSWRFSLTRNGGNSSSASSSPTSGGTTPGKHSWTQMRNSQVASKSSKPRQMPRRGALARNLWDSASSLVSSASSS
jgi:hypothetical protein